VHLVVVFLLWWHFDARFIEKQSNCSIGGSTAVGVTPCIKWNLQPCTLLHRQHCHSVSVTAFHSPIHKKKKSASSLLAIQRYCHKKEMQLTCGIGGSLWWWHF